MSRNPTWFSIKNRLTAGSVKASNDFERFLTIMVTTYGCIDIWYQQLEESSNVYEIRIFYLQKDSTYTASNSWERAGERPKFWMQIKGTEGEIRATVISLLPRLSQLHLKKRHGEWNFGAVQPYEGQGAVVTRTDIGGTFYTVITGRFGDLLLSNDGSVLDWEDITWSFDGCEPRAQAPDSDQVCFKSLTDAVFNCEDTVAVTGTCVRGSCGSGWEAAYPVTEAGCVTTADLPTKAWFSNQDLTDTSVYNQAYWNNYFSCPDPTGTCIHGTCSTGFTATSGVTEAACTANPGLYQNGKWYAGVTPSPSEYDNLFNCTKGCCRLGPDCDFVLHPDKTSAECDALLALSSYTEKTFTPGLFDGCNEFDIRKANGCDDSSANNPPDTITVTLQWAYSGGSLIEPGNSCYVHPCHASLNDGLGFRFQGDNGDEIVPAITPGSAINPPDFYNIGGPEETWETRGIWHSEWTYTGTDGNTRSAEASGFNIPGFDKTRGFTNGTKTFTYIFDRRTDSEGNQIGDEENCWYDIRPLTGSNNTFPFLKITGSPPLTLTKKNGNKGEYGCEDWSYHSPGCWNYNASTGFKYYQESIEVQDEIITVPSNCTVKRSRIGESADYYYYIDLNFGNSNVGTARIDLSPLNNNPNGGADFFGGYVIPNMGTTSGLFPCYWCSPSEVPDSCTQCWQGYDDDGDPTCPAWHTNGVACGYKQYAKDPPYSNGTDSYFIPNPRLRAIGITAASPTKNQGSVVSTWGASLTNKVYDTGTPGYIGVGDMYGDWRDMSANQTTVTVVES